MIQGNILINELCDFLGCNTDRELAGRLGVTPARVAQLRGHNNIDERYMARFIKRALVTETNTAFKSAIKPIVEFFPIQVTQVRENGRDYPLDTASEHGATLVNLLRNAQGIYSFYNSQAEVIYFGKTEELTLFDEIVNAFNRPLPSYTLYRVRHPWDRFKLNQSNELRRIQKTKATLAETASYFSAYSIAEQLIGGLEALIIRLAPNDIINVKIESKDMEAFSEPEL